MPKRVRPLAVRPVPTLGQPHPRGYRAKIGDKRFWLGRDRGQAQELLNLIVAEWATLQRASAQPTWTPAALALIEQAKATHRDVAAAGIPAPAAAPAVRAGLSLSAAIESYMARRRQDMHAGQIQGSRLSLIHYALARLPWGIADQPIAQIGPEELRGLIQFFLRRPVSRSTGKPLGPQTVIETLYVARKFFEDLRDRGLWDTPQSLERIFAYRRDNLWTDSEREAASEVKVFTLTELDTIWRAAGDGSRSQLYMALALNCGFTQMEIATLRHAHLHLDGEKPYLQRFRNKTRVRSKWRLWPETVTLLRRHMTDPAASDLAVVGLRGRPLVRINGLGRADDVRHDWQTIRKRIAAQVQKQDTAVEVWKAQFQTLKADAPDVAENLLADLRAKIAAGPTEAEKAAQAARPRPFVAVRPLGFKFLRKTASNLIRRLENKDTAEVFLAHVDPTIGRKYHNPDFKRLNRGLRKLRARIWPAEVPAAAPPAVE